MSVLTDDTLDIVELTDDDIEWALLSVDGEEVSRTTGDAYVKISFDLSHRSAVTLVNRVLRIGTGREYLFERINAWPFDTIHFTLVPDVSWILG